ncbi:MAG: ankyrin repeat domain-containing protein [Alphaproteobacteria bacterium]|nr:MAG: ankyrin repeat domain-containing protein [Alphaproteobacteria bacterium]
MMTQPEAQQEFFDAFLKEDAARLEASLKAGADPDLKDAAHGFSYSLIIAVVHAQRDMLHLLLKYGATVDVIDDVGDTPLLVAARLGKPEIAGPLLDKGASLDVLDGDGLTPAGIAVEKGNMPLQRLFAKTAMQREEAALNAEVLPLTEEQPQPFPSTRRCV